MTCWRCGAPAEGTFCNDCGAIQPPAPGVDHFTRLGLPQRYAQSQAEINERQHALLAQAHPDRFATAGAEEHRIATERATAINDAVRTLSDPVRRVEYLLVLRGAAPAAGDQPAIGHDTRCVIEATEIREAIHELEGPDAHVERGRLANELVRGLEETLGHLGRRLDGAEPGDDAAVLALAARLRLLREAIDELDRLSTV